MKFFLVILLLAIVFELFISNTFRKILGVLLIIFGIIATLSIFGVVFGVPMIIMGVILFFIGGNK